MYTSDEKLVEKLKEDYLKYIKKNKRRLKRRNSYLYG